VSTEEQTNERIRAILPSHHYHYPPHHPELEDHCSAQDSSLEQSSRSSSSEFSELASPRLHYAVQTLSALEMRPAHTYGLRMVLRAKTSGKTPGWTSDCACFACSGSHALIRATTRAETRPMPWPWLFIVSATDSNRSKRQLNASYRCTRIALGLNEVTLKGSEETIGDNADRVDA
jgi:hypothetical protein